MIAVQKQNLTCPETMAKYREDFPILSSFMNGKPLVYLDTASSAQKPYAVMEAMEALYRTHYANIHRGLYAFSQDTTLKFEQVRQKISDFIHAPSERGIIFTRNTTEAINLVASSWGRTYLKKNDEIILSQMEHHANIVPWQILAQEIGCHIRVIPMNQDGTLHQAAFLSLLSERTKMIGLVHVSNALGTINPVQKMIAQTKIFNPQIFCLVDGSQSVVHGSVDIQALGCDAFCFTGHKLYGPNGVGALWFREEILESLPPYQGGGDMIETVSFEAGSTFKSGAAKFEAGTPAIAEVIALGAAIDYVQGIGLSNITAHEQTLLRVMERELQAIDGLKFYCAAPERAGVVSFSADWAHSSDIAMILDQQGIAVRTGHHCCMPLMKYLGVEGTVRASLGLYSNESDVMALCEGLKKAKEILA